jgi:hypothetical protein
MKNYKRIYISIEEFQHLKQQHIPYTGFVTGLGYAYVTIVPGYSSRYQGATRWSPVFIQEMESTPETVFLSYPEAESLITFNPDGNTFGSFKKSRIRYSGNGIFRVNLDRLHNYTRNNIRAASNDPRNWKPGEIGISTVVGEFSYQQHLPVSPPAGLPRLSPVYDATREGYDIMERNTKAVTAQSTGLPDRRVHSRPVTTGNAGGAATRGGAGLTLVLDVFYIGSGLITAYWVTDDMEGIAKDQKLLREAFKAVKEGISKGLVPEKYQNQNDLGAIINFVYQGVNETGNPEITKIGIDILKWEGKYDPDKAAK